MELDHISRKNQMWHRGVARGFYIARVKVVTKQRLMVIDRILWKSMEMAILGNKF